LVAAALATSLFAEARCLHLTIVLVSGAANNTVKWPMRFWLFRAEASTWACTAGLEAIALALAAPNRDGAVTTLERLNALRIAVIGQRHDVG
jgi:hypothetical protein